MVVVTPGTVSVSADAMLPGLNCCSSQRMASPSGLCPSCSRQGRTPSLRSRLRRPVIDQRDVLEHEILLQFASTTSWKPRC
jgi:hypothetical protein